MRYRQRMQISERSLLQISLIFFRFTVDRAKNRVSWHCIFFSCAILAACGARAENEPLNVQGLNGKWSLPDVINAVESNNSLIKKAASKIDEMGDSTTLAKSAYFPSLFLQSTGSNSLSNQFILQQKIYDGGASIAAIEISKNHQKMAEFDKAVQAEKLRIQTIEAYYNALFARHRRAYYEESYGLIAQALETAERQFKYRSISKDALLRGKVEFRKIRASSFDAKNAETEAVRALSHLTHRADFSIDWLEDRFNLNEIPPPYESGAAHDIERNFEASPVSQYLRASEVALNAEKNLELSIDRPNLSFIASLGLGQAPSISVNYVYEAGLQAGLSLTIPLFSGFSSFARKRIYGEKDMQIQQELKNTHDDFNFEFAEKAALLNQDRQDLQLIRKELQSSQETWKEADANYRVGLSSPEVWFESLASVQQWKMRQMEKTRDYWITLEYLNRIAKQNL